MQRCLEARVLLVCNAGCESVGQPLRDPCGVFFAFAPRACSVMSPVALQLLAPPGHLHGRDALQQRLRARLSQPRSVNPFCVSVNMIDALQFRCRRKVAPDISGVAHFWLVLVWYNALFDYCMLCFVLLLNLLIYLHFCLMLKYAIQCFIR